MRKKLPADETSREADHQTHLHRFLRDMDALIQRNQSGLAPPSKQRKRYNPHRPGNARIVAAKKHLKDGADEPY